MRHPDLVLLDPKREFDYFEKVVIYRRDKGICQLCGKNVEWKDYEADHVYPHAKGGPTRIENGQVLCGSCNASKGAKIAT
jgi:5-methylcytosine-specific restriction endonuclease McrA